ncbi:MAG: superoxide dismutase family protein [Acidimicrobiia bacterium]|nr:superoxide dismutase family protein [Acidimicrobiia bacterium]MYC46028.1 superoxide dismutase family protein [Acidimicrobiia bacterium]MYI20518.1 superoxide dismutase family protein [Acidimicrobiia bacterium]
MTRQHLLALPLIVASTLILAASGVTSQQDDADETDAGAPLTATAQLMGPDGQAMGTVTLIEGPNGVLVQADLTGLSPGGHGFHIHAVGACEPDFSAAGDHFNPEGIGHGFMVEGGWHAGDLPNIYAAADGTARADTFTSAVTLTPGAENSIFDVDGSAIIVHAEPDSYGESPGAGDRVACGVIRPGQPEPAGGGATADDGPAEAGPGEDLPAG